MKYKILASLALSLTTSMSSAAWDYSTESKFAIYDASFDSCKNVDIKTATKGREKHRSLYESMEPEKLKEIRNTEEYKMIYRDAARGFSAIISREKVKARKIMACKAIMGVDGYHL
jgi:hypothetical protein